MRLKAMRKPTELSKQASMEWLLQHVNPVEAAGTLAMGKIWATNALSRFGMKIPPIRRIGQEMAGVGYRTAQKGYPQLRSITRHGMAVLGDPKLTSVYEMAHDLGQRASPAELHGLGGIAKAFVPHNKDVGSIEKFVQGIPLESKGWRAAVDYGFKPAKEVGRDVGNIARNAAGATTQTLSKAKAYGQKPVSEVGSDLVGLARRVGQRGL